MLMQILSRLCRMALTFFVIVTLVFFATRLTGNPVDYIMAEGMSAEDRAVMIRYYGLDQPVMVQYFSYLRSLVDGQFGLSFLERRPVADMVFERLWPTGQLILSSVAVMLIVSIPLGIVAAIWRKSWIGSAVMVVAFMGYAVPNFVMAVLLILTFSYWLNWLPVVGNGTWLHFIMPTAVMSGLLVASLTRFTRNAMLDVLGQDFMRTARAKGLPERAVILRHGLRNAGITILSVIGLQMATMAAAGSVVVESIFAWPGIGELLVKSALNRDYPVLQFGVLTVAAGVILVNAAIDLSYGWADPRMRKVLT